jgi:hypothetical protein
LAVVDGQAGAQYDGIGEGSLVFSADGKRMAYAALNGKKFFVVVDGQAGAQYDAIGSPVFSPDGKRVAYRALQGQKSSVVLDVQTGAGYDAILEGSPIFNANGGLEYLAIKEGALYRVQQD